MILRLEAGRLRILAEPVCAVTCTSPLLPSDGMEGYCINLPVASERKILYPVRWQ